MDLSTDISGASEIAGRASGRMCCDPAFGFADQSTRWAKETAQPTIQCSTGTSNCRYGRSEDNVFGGAACAAEMAAGDRDNFLDGCLKVQEDERLRLGRELHDSTGQLLLALRLGIAHLRQVRGTAAEDVAIDEIDEMAQQIDREVRAFAYTHYPADVGRDGLVAALQSLARGFASRTGLDIAFSSLPMASRQKPGSALALLRVAQEALMNVHRHAQATHVKMSLAMHGDMLKLVVRDDGIGIPTSHDVEKSRGVGLQGMRHRVERLAGHIAIKRLKHGTKVIASVPA
jgi:signal transduction histidine kinase